MPARLRAKARAATLLLWAVAACSSGPEHLSTEELLDPETCKRCHPNHYEEWAGSMHAYAADDPVFLAMNQRGQRETGGELGDFCVGCHAPMAVRTGATADGINLDEVPRELKGVTCYFCHSVEAVEGEHNNPLRLADDDVLRGGIRDPIQNGAHRMAYSSLHDRTRRESSDLCGSCHDIVTPAGVHLERTFQEWKESLFGSEDPRQMLTCGRCHMPGDRPGVIADFPGVPVREFPDAPTQHTFPGIDVALTPWPDTERQLEHIARDLAYAITPRLCVTPAEGGYQIEYTLDNVFAGHMWPSGAAQDRRAWAEVVVHESEEIVYASGRVQEGQPVAEAAASDPDLWQMRDFAYGENGEKAHMFWDIREVESDLLPPAVTNDISDPRFNHSVTRSYQLAGALPDRITAVVHIRPIGLDVLDDLIESGDLDPAIRDEVPTLTLEGTALAWTEEDGFDCVDP